MKRAIGLIFIYIIEILFGIFYFVKSLWNKVVSAIPFFNNIADFFRSILKLFRSWLNFSFFNNLPLRAQNIIVIILLNIIFTIIYLIFFGVLTFIIRKSKQKKMARERNRVFTLSEEEKAKFEWKLYERKFPGRRLISLIVPIFLMLTIVVIRFDKSICEQYDSFNKGYFDVFNNCKPYIGSFGSWCETVISKYIGLNNNIVNAIGVTWVEWIEIALVTIVICLLWYGFFSLFAKPFRRYQAKKRAKRARAKYVYKMELLEYKAWKKAQKEKEISQKNRDLYDSDNALITDVEADVKSISNVEDSNVIKPRNNIDSPSQQAYIDDISTGVTDLGIIEEDNDEIQQPIISRETHFVGDEDVDIVLEEEPILETIEEKDEFFDDILEEDETFDRYLFESTPSLNIDDKVKKYNIEVIEDGQIEEEVEIKDDILIMEYDDAKSTQVSLPVIKNEKKDIDIISPSEVTSINNQGEKKKKPIKPIDIRSKHDEVIDYIVDTSKSQSVSLKSEDVQIKLEENIKQKNVLLHEIKEKKNIKPINPIKVK